MYKYYCTYCGMWRHGCEHVKLPRLKKFIDTVKCIVAVHKIVYGEACMRHKNCARCIRCGEHV